MEPKGRGVLDAPLSRSMTAACCATFRTSIAPEQRRNPGRSIIFRVATQNVDLNNSKFRSNIGSRVHSME
jgi:hypothetical protein